jgi:hypothetical protein
VKPPQTLRANLYHCKSKTKDIEDIRVGYQVSFKRAKPFIRDTFTTRIAFIITS